MRMTKKNGKPEAGANSRARDLDETRRLAYMALFVNKTTKYNLAGTLVNALKHHHAVDLDVSEIADHVVNVIEGSGSDSDTWLRGQIDRITGELGGE